MARPSAERRRKKRRAWCPQRMRRGPMARIRVVTDSACDLSAEVAAAHGVTIVPLSIRFGDEEFVDGKDLEHLEKGCRIGGARALLGSLLSSNPVVTLVDDAVAEESNQRTRGRSL